jgi:hypothetical protein
MSPKYYFINLVYSQMSLKKKETSRAPIMDASRSGHEIKDEPYIIETI